MISVGSKDQIIMLPVLGEIFLPLVNDPIRTDRAHHIQPARAAHASRFSPKRFGNLHRRRTRTTGRTIDQNLLPWLNLPFIVKPPQDGDAAEDTGASSSNEMPAGFDAKASSPAHTYSAKPPRLSLDRSPNSSSPG